MRNPLTNRIVIFGLFFLIFLNFRGISYSQLLNDTATVTLVRKGINYIYSQEFDKAEDILTDINGKYPGHPATYLYKAIVIYYQNYPLIPANPQFRGFESQLRTSIRICELKSGWLNDPEKLLIDFCSRGLLMLCYSENGMSNEVIPIALSSYKCVRKSFRYKSVYPDFCYFTGLYNYYREAYPELHPAYRTVAILFPRGDKKAGLNDLQIAAENAIVLKAEAYSILSWIYLFYEKNYPEALEYSKTISLSYPSNLLFRGEYIKNLLLLKKYDDAEKILKTSENEQHAYFKGQLAYFRGVLQEKRYQNYALAGKYYEECIAAMKNFEARGKEFSDYSSNGLKRIKELQKF